MNTIVRVESVASINGRVISRGNTILAAGHNLIGRRIFDSAYTSQIAWVRFKMTTYGNVVKATTYTETSSTVHKINYDYTWDQAPDNWTALDAMFANSTSDSYIAASDSDFGASQPVNSSDVMQASFTFTLSGNSWASDGFKAIGHRMCDPSNSYGCINYFSFDGGTTRILGTYANVSSTVHDLSMVLATTEASTSTRLYSAASGGTLCFNQSATRNLVAGQPFKFRMTVS